MQSMPSGQFTCVGLCFIRPHFHKGVILLSYLAQRLLNGRVEHHVLLVGIVTHARGGITSPEQVIVSLKAMSNPITVSLKQAYFTKAVKALAVARGQEVATEPHVWVLRQRWARRGVPGIAVSTCRYHQREVRSEQSADKCETLEK